MRRRSRSRRAFQVSGGHESSFWGTYAGSGECYVSLKAQVQLSCSEYLLCKSFSGTNDQAGADGSSDSWWLSASPRLLHTRAPTNHGNMSCLEGACQLDMVWIVESTTLNLRILPTERFRHGVLGIVGLLHYFDAQNTRRKSLGEVQWVNNLSWGG